MQMLKVYSYADESVVYNINSGDLHLLSNFNTSLLGLMKNKDDKNKLIVSISETYHMDFNEAELYLHSLYLTYRELNLID